MKLSKKVQKLFAMLLVAVMVVSVLPIGSLSVFATVGEFAGGDGTAEKPYLIATKTQLNNVRNYLKANFKLIADIEFTDADFQSGGDFYNNGAGFEPIGVSYNYAFNGTFDGDNHVIKNLYINIVTDTDGSAGLFGYNKGTIKNIGMVDGNVSVSATASECHAYAGSIVGYVVYGTIENCYNTGSVSATSASINAIAGGIVGNNGGTIKNCYNTGRVSAEGNLTSYSEMSVFAGGIVGFDVYGTTENCYNTGSVSATAYYTEAISGGIVGDSYNGTIRNCYNTGSISASSSKYAYSGGIVGYNNATINNSCNIGSIYADGYYSSYSGGIAGINQKSITSCYNSGNVSSSSSYSFAYSGGIASMNENADMKNCYNIGNISATSKDNSPYVGGIVGVNDGTTIINCYNIGSMSATSNDRTCYVGGIAGDSFYGIITNGYYADNISKGVGRGDDATKKCTVEELKQQSTFVGFDFDTVWTIKNNIDYPYPVLQGIPTGEDSDYTIDGEYIFGVRAGTKASTLIDGITEGDYCKVYKNGVELDDNDLVGTGMTVKLIDGDTVIATYTLVVAGDINGSGKVDSADYLLIKRAAFGTYTMTEAMNFAGDINSDNLINSADYLLVKRACFGTYKI